VSAYGRWKKKFLEREVFKHVEREVFEEAKTKTKTTTTHTHTHTHTHKKNMPGLATSSPALVYVIFTLKMSFVSYQKPFCLVAFRYVISRL